MDSLQMLSPCRCNKGTGRVTGLQTTRIHAASNRSDDENLEIFSPTYLHGVCTKSMSVSKGSYRYVTAINVQAVSGLPTTQFHAASNRVEENLGIFGASYRHGTAFVLKQYLYQKKATGMERLKM